MPKHQQRWRVRIDGQDNIWYTCPHHAKRSKCGHPDSRMGRCSYAECPGDKREVKVQQTTLVGLVAGGS